MSSMSQYSFKCFMASCCSSILAFLQYWPFCFHILDCLFHCLSHYFHNFHILLHYLFFLLNNNLFIVFFNLIFEVYSLEKGSHASYMELSTFFLNAEHFVTKFSPEFSVLFLFYTHFSMPMFGYMSHTSSMSDLTSSVLSCCCSSTFNPSSILTSIAFSELYYILWARHF